MAPTVLLECTQNKVIKRSFEMMGKSQKFSQGFPPSYVPDYRYVAETMGETEGFGSSGRVHSDNSSLPKRKCIGLNTEKDNYFNVPLQVYTYTKMAHSERKELELKLKSDLERIQNLQKKFLTKSLAAVSSSSNGHGKKPGSNAPLLKRGSLGRFESTKQKAQAQAQLTNSNSHAAIMKQCESILNKLRTHQFGWVFNSPVDVVALKIPDYYTVIKHPMDLGTIKNKLSSGAYSSPLDFVADVRLTFTNAMTYNPPGNDVHIMADKLSNFFESKWKPIAKKLPIGSIEDKYVNRETEAAEAANKISHQKKRKLSPLISNQFTKEEKVLPKVSTEERHQVSNRLSSIAENMPDSIVDFLSQHIKSTNNEEIEVDFDVLSDGVILELKKLLDDCCPEKPIENKSNVDHKSNVDPSEMEVVNKPEHSSMHPNKGSPNKGSPNKGNEPIDEDVDIGDNNPLISSYPPVVIDKDSTHRSSKCSSSSSSSSDSSSSSSDSDSGSSSSESENGCGIFLKSAKDNEFAAKPDQEKSIITNTAEINKSIAGSDQSEHNASSNPIPAEGDVLLDGENALSEKHVSPDKLYRAAWLKGRFADTIIKAREKTLDQGDKGDHEKLRQEREELERQQKEEKARLQAEAKAAEAARKRAEAAAAAEAKRQRELEREAARQELLKVEKTVEINENCSIMKDLEMLDETSPDHIEDEMGGFKIGGSNPLEQLGLYRKDDEEEEEEPLSDKPILHRTHDVEEGEID